jgi:hypothetical protein
MWYQYMSSHDREASKVLHQETKNLAYLRGDQAEGDELNETKVGVLALEKIPDQKLIS